MNPLHASTSIHVLKLRMSLNPIPLLWFGQRFPILPMNLPFIAHLTPPKSCARGIQLIAKLFWQLKHTHSVGRNGLSSAFISTSFPVLNNNLPFHSCNFFQTLSLRKEKVWYFERPIRVGRPKYDSNLSTSFTPSLFFIHFLCLAPMLLL